MLKRLTRPRPRGTPPHMSKQQTELTGAGALGRRIAEELDWITLMKVTQAGFDNARANSERILQGKSILALRESPLMKGDDALIIAAGPSIHRFDTEKIIKESNFTGTI